MKRVLTMGFAIAAMITLANVNTASADHCRSGSRYRGGYGYRYSSPYVRGYRYSTPYYGSYYRNRGYYGYGPRYRGYGGSGIYYQNRNFGFGLRY